MNVSRCLCDEYWMRSFCTHVALWLCHQGILTPPVCFNATQLAGSASLVSRGRRSRGQPRQYVRGEYRSAGSPIKKGKRSKSKTTAQVLRDASSSLLGTRSLHAHTGRRPVIKNRGEGRGAEGGLRKPPSHASEVAPSRADSSGPPKCISSSADSRRRRQRAQRSDRLRKRNMAADFQRAAVRQLKRKGTDTAGCGHDLRSMKRRRRGCGHGSAEVREVMHVTRSMDPYEDMAADLATAPIRDRVMSVADISRVCCAGLEERTSTTHGHGLFVCGSRMREGSIVAILSWGRVYSKVVENSVKVEGGYQQYRLPNSGGPAPVRLGAACTAFSGGSVNEANEAGERNAAIVEVPCRGGLATVIVSVRDIPVDEEVLVSYGPEQAGEGMWRHRHADMSAGARGKDV